MGVAPDWYGGHPGLVWGSPRTGMGPGIGIISIGYIELGPYVFSISCLLVRAHIFAYFYIVGVLVRSCYLCEKGFV